MTFLSYTNLVQKLIVYIENKIRSPGIVVVDCTVRYVNVMVLNNKGTESVLLISMRCTGMSHRSLCEIYCFSSCPCILATPMCYIPFDRVFDVD